MADRNEIIIQDFLARDYGLKIIRDSEAMKNIGRNPYIMARVMDSGISPLTIQSQVQRSMTLQLSIGYPSSNNAERDAKTKAEQIFADYKLGYTIPGHQATAIGKSIFSHDIDAGWVKVIARVNFRLFYTET